MERNEKKIREKKTEKKNREKRSRKEFRNKKEEKRGNKFLIVLPLNQLITAHSK